MQRKLFFLLLVAFLLPGLIIAQNGKLRGNVTDKETGEPLIGATVTLEGTTLGASTDINGEYFILNVPPGAQTVKATYVGYAPVTVSEFKISAGLTSTLNFNLPPTSVQVEPVSIVAERPLIQRNTTNTVLIIRREDIKDLPFRGIQNIVALAAGVVQQNGQLYIRGGRANEVGYYIDGANVSNPFYGDTRRQNVTILQEALEEFQLQEGGMTAEYGGANAGIIRTTLRTGGQSIKGTVDYRTDDFAKPGKEFLKTSSFGRRIGTFTIGGPVPAISSARFFVTGTHDYLRNRQVIFLEPFRFDSLRTDALGTRPAGELLPGPIEIRRNYLPSNWQFSNAAQGTLLFDVNPFKLRFGGSYEFVKSRNGGSWPGYLSNIYGEKRNTVNETNIWWGNVRATHIVNPTTYYELGLSYQSRSGKTFDPDFGDQYLLYPDSIANAAKGYTGFVSRYQGPLRWSTINAFTFLDPNTPNNGYSKFKHTSIGASLDLTSQITPKWEVKVGGRLDSWVIRSYSFDNISNYLVYLYGTDGKSPRRQFSSAYEERVRLTREGRITNYGYDINGNETDGTTFGDLTVDKPQKPLFAAAYIQNRFEYNDLIVNVGVRYEYMDPKGLRLPESAFNSPRVDEALNLVDERQYVNLQSFSLVLPRISFSFPVTDRTVFFAQYGKFAQFPSLNQIYGNTVQFSGAVNPSTRQPYSLGAGSRLGWLLKPERSTQYEVGLRQALTDNLAFTLTGFYKDQKDQASIRRVFNALGVPVFVALQNEDFGTTKGVEMTLQLRRTNRLAAQVNFTLSDARGTGSETLSTRNAVTDEASARIPLFINPLDYNQAQRGSIFLDYRFDKGDGGSILEGMGLGAVLTFNSGHNYTKIKEPQNLGQATPWNVGVRALLDVRSRNPVEPINNSTTPAVFNVDLTYDKMFYLGAISLDLYVNVLNVFNTKQILNVYPQTGTPQDDGWLKNPLADQFKAIPNYEAFYRAINLQNRWAYLQNIIGAGDLFGSPRQIRVGARIEY